MRQSGVYRLLWLLVALAVLATDPSRASAGRLTLTTADGSIQRQIHSLAGLQEKFQLAGSRQVRPWKQHKLCSGASRLRKIREKQIG